MIRTILAVTASMALTTAVVTNAWLQKKQFYPTVVHLTRSNQSMLILYIQVRQRYYYAQMQYLFYQGVRPRFPLRKTARQSVFRHFATSGGRELDGKNLVRHYRHLPCLHHVS